MSTSFSEFVKPALNAAMETEAAWVAELERSFPGQYPDIRYTPLAHGYEGSYLRAAYEAHSAAMKAYHRAKEQAWKLVEIGKIAA